MKRAHVVEISMPSFLPSEIGRLIYGYLQSECNEDIANEFLNACDSMKECRRQKERGREFPCKVQNLTLTDMLNRYSVLSSLIFDHTSGNEFNHHNILNSLQNLLKSKLSSLTNFYHNASVSNNIRTPSRTEADESRFSTLVNKDVPVQHETEAQNESCPRVCDVDENVYPSNETADTFLQKHAAVSDLETTRLTSDNETSCENIHASPRSHRSSVSSTPVRRRNDTLTTLPSSQVDGTATICTPDFKLKNLAATNSQTKTSSTKLSHVSPSKSTQKELQAKYQSSNRKLEHELQDMLNTSSSNQSRKCEANRVESNSVQLNSTEDGVQPISHTEPIHASQQNLLIDSTATELKNCRTPNKVAGASPSNQSQARLSSRKATTRIPVSPVESHTTEIRSSSCKPNSTTPNGKTRNFETLLSRRSWSISPAAKTKNALDEFISSPLRIARTPSDSKVRAGRSQPVKVAKTSSPGMKISCQSNPDVVGRMNTRTPVKALHNSPVTVTNHLHEKTKLSTPAKNTQESQYRKIKPLILRKTTSCSLPVTRLKSHTKLVASTSQGDVKQSSPLKASPRANKIRSGAAPATETLTSLKLLPNNLASKSIPWDYNLRQAIADETKKKKEQEEAEKGEDSRKALRKRKRDDLFDEKELNKKNKVEEKPVVVCKKRKKMEELARAQKRLEEKKERKKEYKADDTKSGTSRKSDSVKKHTQNSESRHRSAVVEDPQKVASPSPSDTVSQNDLPNKVMVDHEEDDEEEMPLNLEWSEEMIFYHTDGADESVTES